MYLEVRPTASLNPIPKPFQSNNACWRFWDSFRCVRCSGNCSRDWSAVKRRPMFPLCLILGDSTGVGTAAALAAVGVRCEMHARVGASSTEALRTWTGGRPVPLALIALGSNDPTNPALAKNLVELRRRTVAARVTWLAPYHPAAARVVVGLARAFGDDVVSLAYLPSRDRVHPSSYKQIALSLGWAGISASIRSQVTVRSAAGSVVRAPVSSSRVATVLVFDR